MTISVELTTHTPQGVEKIARYGWTLVDEQGQIALLDKSILQSHPAYQRDLIPGKIKELSAQWSWVACGAIIVGERGGEYWVIDGQHRVAAAKRRSDISRLPCLLFKTTSVQEEAIGFLRANTSRKPVTSIGKHKALVAADDAVSKHVQATLDKYAIVLVSHPTSAKEFAAVRWATDRAMEDKESFDIVFAVAFDLCVAENMPMPVKLLDGLWMLHMRVDGGLTGKRLLSRIRQKGASTLLEAANRAAAYYATGGAKVWAEGMLTELNKQLVQRFAFHDNDK